MEILSDNKTEMNKIKHNRPNSSNQSDSSISRPKPIISRPSTGISDSSLIISATNNSNVSELKKSKDVKISKDLLKPESNIVAEDKSLSPKKRKHIDILRDQVKQRKEQVTNTHINKTVSTEEKIRKRKVAEKQYVSMFMKKMLVPKKYKSIEQGDVNPNELVIKMYIPEDSDINRFEVGLLFDHYDDVRTIILSDKDFYTGLFYTEVIKTERYKEAWQILRQRYKISEWIEKYLHFLLHAPPIIPILMDL